MPSAPASASASPIQRLFAHIPEVPSFDPTTVRGNVTDEEKRIAAKVFAHFGGTGKKTAFVPWIADKIRYTGMNVYGREEFQNHGKLGRVRAEAIHEVVVTEDMCNSFGVLHGACASLFLDMCTISPIVILGLALGIDTTGVTQAMNTIYHQPARLGRTLRIVANTISADGRIRSSRGEIWDGDTLCISCVHSIVHVGEKMKEKGGKL
ncbi:hypothetical protein AX17_006491 [Amanita inopinata Kibby_2008]|nr:hypothetical protein AX17_006491 [Amanita inopinata Kibby_2008]